MSNNWTYKGKIVEQAPEGAFGFIYEIVNKTTGKRYIGRKYLATTKRKPLTKAQKAKGRTRRDVVRGESNWRSYQGSCKPLLADIKAIGKENFTFEILAFAETKGQINYLEMYYQFVHHALLDSNYYNDAIGSNKFSTIKDPEKLLELLK